MLKRLSLLLAVALLSVPLGVPAVGLGDITLNSALDEPLRAEITLISVTADEAELLSVQLAQPDQFKRVGIELTGQLRRLQFEAVSVADGKVVVRVTTKEPVREPFLNFLVEVSWPAGKVLREYTVLLDPPVLMRGAPPISQTPSISEPAAERPPAISAPSTAPASGAMVGSSYGPVTSGETLWVIAETVRPDSALTVHQMMIALQRANPEAFVESNINGLRAGAVLRIPERDEIAQVGAREAVAASREQYAEWTAYRQRRAERATPTPKSATGTRSASGAPDAAPATDARLQLVVPETKQGGPKAAGPEGAGSGTAADLAELNRQLAMANEESEARRIQNEELTARVKSLEEQIASLQKLITLNDAELAALQKSLDGSERVVAPTGAATDGAGQAAPAAADGATPPIATAPPMAAKPPVPPPAPPEPSLVELLGDPLVLGGGAVLIVVLLLFAMLRRRSSAAGASAPPAPAAKPPPGPASSAPAATAATTAAAPAAAVAVTTSAVRPAVEKSDFDEFHAEHAPAAARSEHSEDPLNEADVYLAYGRYDQAGSLLREALNGESGRTDYMLKLLEVYQASKNRDAFERQLEELHETLAGETGPQWDRAVQMARQVVPEHRLLEGEERAAAPIKAATEIMDADEDELDIDLDFEPVFGDEAEFGATEEPLGITQVVEIDRFAAALEQQTDDGEVIEESVATAVVDDGELDFDLSLDDEGTEPAAGDERPESVELDALADLDLDFDFDGDDQPARESLPGAGLSLDGEDSATEEGLDLDFGDELPDLDLERQDGGEQDDAVDLDMVATKLELAQAYLEMEDIDGATTILREVLQEGSEAQVQQAQALLERAKPT